jgi:hypothetical protein
MSSSLNYCHDNYIIVNNNFSEYIINLGGFRFFWDNLYSMLENDTCFHIHVKKNPVAAN